MTTLASICRAADAAMPYAIVGIYTPLCIVALIMFADLYLGLAILLIALASPFIGAFVIWLIVWLINRSDDPRRNTFPQDAP
jgi:hypothetical protein